VTCPADNPLDGVSPFNRERLAKCQASCPFIGALKCPLLGCPWRCQGCSEGRPRDLNGYHLDRVGRWRVLCNRVKVLGLIAGWVRPHLVGWQNGRAQWVEWQNAEALRVDWTWDALLKRECEEASALPQQFAVSPPATPAPRPLLSPFVPGLAVPGLAVPGVGLADVAAAEVRRPPGDRLRRVA
jgi:hypothetical protein